MTDLCDIHGLILCSPHHPQTSSKQSNVGNTLTTLLKYEMETYRALQTVPLTRYCLLLLPGGYVDLLLLPDPPPVQVVGVPGHPALAPTHLLIFCTTPITRQNARFPWTISEYASLIVLELKLSILNG